jgi:hypothetical protein
MPRAQAIRPAPNAGTSLDSKLAFASDLADINAFTLQLLSDKPDLFDFAARSALGALVSMVAAVQGHEALQQMLKSVASP